MSELEALLSVGWVAWGVLPFVAANVGYWLTALALELILERVLAESTGAGPLRVRYGAARGRVEFARWFKLVEYGSVDRARALAETRAKNSFGKQVRGAAMQMLGPMALMSAGLAGYILPMVMPTAKTAWPTAADFVLQLVVMELVGDFFLYWGHRIQHENKFLWEKFHSVHHQNLTPSPVSTLYIDGTDAFLQASLPLLLAAIIARAHHVSFILYTGLRVTENTLNHCGLDSPLLQLCSLKFLPGRAPPAFHDYHHRFSNYAGRAKNFGENFWLWDHMFGTASCNRHK
jgi:sterol desaturase/sphingolipid hydroxylase (fatty acid hydroxylase superfamily)